jgi:hypothetical protein
MMSARRLSVRNEPQLEQRAEYSGLQYALAMAYNGVFWMWPCCWAGC